jgi:hypothetical protein
LQNDETNTKFEEDSGEHSPIRSDPEDTDPDADPPGTPRAHRPSCSVLLPRAPGHTPAPASPLTDEGSPCVIGTPAVSSDSSASSDHDLDASSGSSSPSAPVPPSAPSPA